MKLHEHYSRFLGEDNIYKTIGVGQSKVINSILIGIFIVASFSLLCFSTTVSKTEKSFFKVFDTWSFYLMIICLLSVYILLIIERTRQYEHICDKAGYLNQNKLSVILFGISWNSIVLKYFWFEELASKYRLITNNELKSYKLFINKELEICVEPKFSINVPLLSFLATTLVPLIGFIFVAFGIKGREQSKIIILSIILMSPIFLIIISRVRDSFKDKKRNYTNMQNYSLAVDYILEERERNCTVQDEDTY